MGSVFSGAPQVTRLGLYLASQPGGGAFQYSLTMLAAVAALPADEFHVVVGYSSSTWAPYVDAHGVPAVRIRRTPLGRVVGGTWNRLRLPVGSWRVLAPYVDGFTRTFLRQKCALWVFPSQESWVYRIPVPAVGVIFDLMHRYERRFPEVSASGEYTRRERHYRSVCRWARGILVDSVLGKQQVQSSYGVDGDKLHVLPYVAPDYIYSPASRGAFEQRYQLPKKFLFYPAQLWEHKNHKGLLRAVAQLRTELPDIRLVCVGAPKNGHRTAVEVVQALGLEEMVQFLGYVPDQDMPEFYRRARAVVLPTFFGPTNIPPLEAFATGCPAAVSRVYGMPSQVGDAALLFDPTSVSEMAAVVRTLWTDDRVCRELSDRGLRRSSGWTQRHFAERLCEILRRVCSTGEARDS